MTNNTNYYYQPYSNKVKKYKSLEEENKELIAQIQSLKAYIKQLHIEIQNKNK